MGVMRQDRRDRSAIVGLILAGVVVVVHVVMSGGVHAPIVQPDELGYIDGARHLALGGQRPITGYYPGLSVFLAPFWKLSNDPLAVWHAAQWFNGVCAGLTTLAIWALVPRLSDKAVTISRRTVITAAVSAYPALVLYSTLSMAESLFELGGVLVALLMWRAAASAAHRRGARAWVEVGLVSGLLVAVHPRGLAVVVAVVAVGAVVLQPWRANGPRLPTERRPEGWARLVGLVVGATLGLAFTRIALVAVRPAAGTGLGNYRANDIVSRAVSAGSLRMLGLGLAGQVLYLGVATAGLAPLGVVVGVVDLVRMVRSRAVAAPAAVARAAAGLATLGVLAMSVLFLNGGDRADQLIYGRYNEGVIAAPMVVALAWLVGAAAGQERSRRCLAWLAAGIATLAVGVAALQLGLTPDQREAPIVLTTVLSVLNVLRRTGPGLDVAALGAFGAIVLAVAAGLFVRVPRIAIVAVGTVFALTAADGYSSYLAPGSVARARQDVLASTIRLASSKLHIPVSCVGFDAGIDFTYFNDRFLLPNVPLTPFSSNQREAPCGPLVISSHPQFFEGYPGSQIVTLENDLPLILYVLPGTTQDRLKAAGWLLPADLDEPFPVVSQRALVKPGAVPHTIRSGTKATVRVSVTNAGTGSPWPNLMGLRAGKFAVRLTARWFPAGDPPNAPGEAGDTPLATSVTELPATLLPGQTVVLPLALVPRTPSGAKLAAGQYVVEVAVYQELVGTFPGGTFTFPITVS